MGMVIYNNLPAMSILNENNRNLKKASKAMGQLSLGERIRNAGDDASAYAITEKMKGKIRALDQCNANSDKGKSMIDLASAAVDEQVGILKQIKTCALRATDGVYTDTDRATIQKEVSQMLDQCDDIANQTTFNGIHLLNQRTLSRQDFWFDSEAPYKPNKDNTPVLSKALEKPYLVTQGEPYPLNGNGYDYKQIIKGATYSQNHTQLPAVGDYVWDNASNSVVQVTKDSSGTLYVGNTRIMVNGLSNPATNPPDTSDNISVPEHPPLATTPVAGKTYVGKKEVEWYNGSVKNYKVDTDPITGVLSGFDTYGVDANGKSKSQISVVALDFGALQSVASSVKDLDGKGFSMNCGGCSQFITVMFDASSSVTKLYEGSSGDPVPLSYVVGVADVNMSDLANSLSKTIFNGISVANPVSGGKMLPSSTDVSVLMEKPHRHSLQLDYDAASGKFTISKYGPNMTVMNGIRGEMVEEDYYKPYQIKALQTDVTSAQFTKVKLPMTTVDALFPTTDGRWDTDITPGDWPKEWPKGYDLLTDEEKKQRWAEEVWQYPAKVSKFDADNCVTTMEKANVFLAQVDEALKYLLNSNTTLGAESARLNFTMDNLTTRSENETNAESVMRDTDVAKSYADYVKNNIIGQASQAMLAQANKNSQDVLSLLQ